MFFQAIHCFDIISTRRHIKFKLTCMILIFSVKIHKLGMFNLIPDIVKHLSFLLSGLVLDKAERVGRSMRLCISFSFLFFFSRDSVLRDVNMILLVIYDKDLNERLVVECAVKFTCKLSFTFSLILSLLMFLFVLF